MEPTGLTQREIVNQAMRDRPDDPWPRGEGHVPLGIPGSPRAEKAYHEPGGGFSPSPGSFGVSLWILGADGRRLTTSDDLPLDEVEQRYDWAGRGPIPTLVTRTPGYECRWSLGADDVWRGEWRPGEGAEGAALLVRSVGPAGGPVDSLDWDGRRLVVNHRWVLGFEGARVEVRVGDERDGFAASPGARSWSGEGGWGCARVDWRERAALTVSIRDTAPRFGGRLAHSRVGSALELDLPDADFTASLEAQAANLLMGFVGGQTRPGEPVNYPLAWERDGAYSVVAMARCGQVETAKELAWYFAENDYFGGFGAEGDAPGSAIGAVASVARISGDAEFLRRSWPHVKRKAGLIEEMLAATEPLRKHWVGPIVPRHAGNEDLAVVCRPAKDGLIAGSMDLHYPVLYVSAISYRGLRQAAEMADAVGETDLAARWRAAASGVREAWLAAFGRADLENERTFMSALWPTWIVDADFEPYRRALRERWEGAHGRGRYPTRPLWTYFTVAEAHQWLFLDRPDVVWETLRYFRRNQSSPGLYTWWEGEGEENSFGLWEGIRGWVRPRHVTPHYWTAAEMLLLQVDMLAYVSEGEGGPALVIGGGVPREWLGRDIRVRGLPTSFGLVDWSCAGGDVEVTVRGDAKPPVRLGAAFGEDVTLRVG